MKNISNNKRGLLYGAILLALSNGIQASVANVNAGDNVVLQWNQAALQAIRDTHPGPPMDARMLAILNTCTFDAWAAFDHRARGTQFGKSLKAPGNLLNDAAKNEAIAFAAFRAVSDLFPQAAEISHFRSLMVQQGYNPDNNSMDVTTAAGIGNKTCKKVLDFRHNDNSNQLGDMTASGTPYVDWTGYTPVNTWDKINDPNHWQPLRVPDGKGGYVIQSFVGAQWGKVIPFGLKNWQNQVITPVRQQILNDNGRLGPATVDQPMYREQALEILSYSATLTDQQKVIAEYFADGPSSELPPGHWILYSQFVSHRDNHGVDKDVKMFFAVANTLFDTSIAIWGAKRHFDSVRPITAIHYLFTGQTVNAWAGPFLGTQLISGENWEPYQPVTVVTPPFPEYPSGHSAFSSSAAETLKRITGSDVFGDSYTQAAGVSKVEPGLTPSANVTLSWATFSDASEEAAKSRRYGGIHFSDGDSDSRLMGRKVAAVDWPVIQYYFGSANKQDNDDNRGSN